MAKVSDSSKFVGVKDVREGTIIREDNSLVGILLVNSINFSLKSDEEREAILGGFQNLLNTINTDVQIVVQSRKIDIEPYLQTLRARKLGQTNELLKVQTEGYIQFVESFTKKVDILTKNFFFVVTYTPIKIVGKGKGFSFFKKKTKQQQEDFFMGDLGQLRQRMASIQQGLSAIGLRGVQVKSDEAIQILYETFNATND